MPSIRITKKESEEIVQRFMRNFLAEAPVLSGQLDPSGKSQTVLTEELLHYWKRATIKLDKADISFRIDFRGLLLSEARCFEEAGVFGLACVLYPTWFEHWLNFLITIGARRRGLRDAEILLIIRHTGIRAKSALLKLLGFQRIYPPHLQTLNELLDLRNNFVHFKWREEAFDSDLEEKRERCLSKIPGVIRYLKRLENSQVWGNRKRAIREAAANLSISKTKP